MSKTNSITKLSIAAGTAFVASLAMTNVASAAGTNPFAMNEMSGGYMQLAEAKCGGMKKSKGMDGKCGGKSMNKGMKDGKCGGSKKMKKAEGKCGEGKCGGKKAKQMNMQKDMKDGKCGSSHMKKSEGKCGGKK